MTVYGCNGVPDACDPGDGQHAHWGVCHADHPTCVSGIGTGQTGPVWAHVGFNKGWIPNLYEAHGHVQVPGCDDNPTTSGALDLLAECVQVPAGNVLGTSGFYNYPNLAVELAWDELDEWGDFSHYRVALSDRLEVRSFTDPSERAGTNGVFHRIDVSGGRDGWAAPFGQRIGFKVWAFANEPANPDGARSRSGRPPAWDSAANAHSGWAFTTCPVLPPGLSAICIARGLIPGATPLKRSATWRELSDRAYRDHEIVDAHIDLVFGPPPGVNHYVSSPDLGYGHQGRPVGYDTGKYRYEIETRNDHSADGSSIPAIRVDPVRSDTDEIWSTLRSFSRRFLELNGIEYEYEEPTWVLPRFVRIDKPGAVADFSAFSFRIRTVYMPRGSHYTPSQLPSPNVVSEWSHWVDVACNRPSDDKLYFECANDSRSIRIVLGDSSVEESVLNESKARHGFWELLSKGGLYTELLIWVLENGSGHVTEPGIELSVTMEGAPQALLDNNGRATQTLLDKTFLFTIPELVRRAAVYPYKKLTDFDINVAVQPGKKVTVTATTYVVNKYGMLPNLKWLKDDSLGVLSTVTVEKTCPVPPPVGIRVQCSSTGNSVNVRWYPMHPSHEYRYEIQERNNAFSAAKVHYAYRSYTSVPGETYGFRVRTIHVPTGTPTGADGGKSEWSQWYTVACPGGPLQAPSNVGVECAASGASLTVSWDAVTGAMSYEVRETAGRVPQQPTAATEFITAVTAGQQYSFQVRAVAADGTRSSWSPTRSQRCVAPPSELTAVCSGDGAQVTVRWGAVTGASSYEVDDANGNMARRTVTGTTATVRVSGGTEYGFRVRTVSADDTRSAWSATVTITCNSRPPTPTGLSVDCSSDGATLTVSWTADSSGVSEQYQLVEKDNKIAQRTITAPATTTTLRSTPGTTYVLRIIAYSVSLNLWSPGYGHQDDTVGASTKCPLPRPSGLRVVCVESTDPNSDRLVMLVTWDAMDGAERYEVRDRNRRLTLRTTNTEHRGQGTPGESATYRVRSVAADGTRSDWSGWRSGQCGRGPQVVTGVSVQCSEDGTSLTVSWNRSARADNYAAAEQSNKLTQYWGRVLTNTWTTEPGETYAFRVIAHSRTFGWSPSWSDEVTATCDHPVGAQVEDKPDIAMAATCVAKTMNGDPTPESLMTLTLTIKEKQDGEAASAIESDTYTPVSVLRDWKGYGRGMTPTQYGTETDWWRIHYPDQTLYGEDNEWLKQFYPYQMGQIHRVWDLDSLAGRSSLALALWDGNVGTITKPPMERDYDKHYAWAGYDRAVLQRHDTTSKTELTDPDNPNSAVKATIYTHTIVFTFDARTRTTTPDNLYTRQDNPNTVFDESDTGSFVDVSYYDLYLYRSDKVYETAAAAEKIIRRANINEHSMGTITIDLPTLERKVLAVPEVGALTSEASLQNVLCNGGHKCPLGFVLDRNYPHAYNCCLNDPDYALYIGNSHIHPGFDGMHSCLAFCKAHINPNAAWHRGLGCARLGG